VPSAAGCVRAANRAASVAWRWVRPYHARPLRSLPILADPMKPSRSRAKPARTVAALAALRSALLPLVSRPDSEALGIGSPHGARPESGRHAGPDQRERRDPGGGSSLPALLLAMLLPLGTACASDRPAEGEDPVAATADADRGDRWTDASATGNGEIRVLYVPAEGFAEPAPGGEPRGVTADLMREFARWVEAEEGVAVRIRWVEERDWSRFYARVRDGSGGVFGIGNVTITEARREELRFSPSYLSNVAVLITHRDVPELASLDAIPRHFDGLAALAFAGTLHEERLRTLRERYLPDAPLRTATSNDEIVDAVAAGGHFAYVDGYNFYRAAEAGAPIRRHPAGDEAGEEFGVIMPLDTDWGPLIDRFLDPADGFRADPAYGALLRRYLGEGVAAMLEGEGG
jgi:ABC-type amino acid transport substrate-binding protein